MRPASVRQFETIAKGNIPEPEQISKRLWSVPIPMRSGGSLSYSLSVIHRDHKGTITVIDPGSKTRTGLELLRRFLESIDSKIGDISLILVTHMHFDHAGLADTIRSLSGAPILMHEREQAAMQQRQSDGVAARELLMRQWGVPLDIAGHLTSLHGQALHEGAASISADAFVSDGEVLPIPGLQWRVVLTPGHTPGHVCIANDELEVLLSGDHVLPSVFPGIGSTIKGRVEKQKDMLTQYLESLGRLNAYDGYQIVPGHGYHFYGLGERRQDIARHLLGRARKVAEVLKRAPGATSWDIASRITWRSDWHRLGRSRRAQLAMSQIDQYRDFVWRGGLEHWEEKWSRPLVRRE